MRRTDREITDFAQIREIIEKTEILHLALFDEEYPYIVPMHYGCEFEGEKTVLYMHGAKQGHKLDLLRKNSAACVEIENDVTQTSGGEIPCQYGAIYSSVIARGRVEIPEDSAEKIHGLTILMKHQTGRDFEITETMAETVAVLKFTADCVTAKARKK